MRLESNEILKKSLKDSDFSLQDKIVLTNRKSYQKNKKKLGKIEIETHLHPYAQNHGTTLFLLRNQDVSEQKHGTSNGINVLLHKAATITLIRFRIHDLFVKVSEQLIPFRIMEYFWVH